MTVLKRVEKLEVALNNLSYTVSHMSRMEDKVRVLEKTVMTIGKTLASLTDELTETKVMDSKKVLQRIRDDEDDAARHKVNSLVESGNLEATDTVKPDSLVIVSHTLVLEDGTTDTTSKFTILSMDPETKTLFLEKTVGDTVRGQSFGEQGYEVFEVVAIYQMANKTVEVDESPKAEA